MKNNRAKSVSLFIIMMLVFSVNVGVSEQTSRGEGGSIIWFFDADLFVRHIESADLNDDDIDDVIAAEYDNEGYDDPSNVYGLDGKDGNTLWTYAMNSGARCMTIGDINNDGVMDAIVGASMGSTTPDGKVHVIDGSDGSIIWVFSPGGTGDTIGGVAVGNFNGDAYPDVAVACWDDYVYAVDGATGTELWNREIGSIFINAVATSDVDGNGIDDVSYAHDYLPNYDNKIGVLNGTNGIIIWQEIIPDTAEDTLMADIDDDGEIEAIFGVVKPSDEVEVQVRNGLTGDLEWSSIIGQGPGTINPNIFLFIDDIDQDSDLDLVVGNEYVDFKIRAYEGIHNEAMWESEELNGYPRHMSFSDVNNNSYQNIIAATYDRVQIVNATNGLKDWYQSVAGTIRGTATGDFDGDGVMDVACSGGAELSGDDPAKAVWALKTVDVSPVLWETTIGSYGNALALGDFTGDGVLDAIGVSSDDEAYALNGSDGTILWQWTGAGNLYTVATGDFNNDGVDDAAVAGATDIITALNGVNGSVLWQFTQAGDQYYRKTLETADLNNDGYVDVIAGNDDSFVYAINGGIGGLIWSVDLDGQVRDIDLVQADGYGPIDVVAAANAQIAVINGSDGNILWDYTTDVSNAKNVVALDANNDGNIDVAWGSIYQVELIDGHSQTLSWSQPYKVVSDYGLAAGDMNNDVNEDVIIGGGTTGDEILALDGLDGSTIWDFPSGGDINCVMTSDVNEDGVLEVVAGSDDQYTYVITYQGYEDWSYSTADDVMQVAVGDITGDMNPNIVAITFGFDGVVYAFNTLSENINIPPSADFSYAPIDPTTGDLIQFTDLSFDSDGTIDSWNWDFGDGNTSTLQNPSHQYQNPGDYTVTLLVMDNTEATDSINKTVTVSYYGPIADFSFSPTNPVKDEIVHFTDQSTDNSGGTITLWSWEFGDGSTSTDQNPTHGYSENGTYQVNLTVENDTGVSDMVTKVITVGLVSVDLSLVEGWNLVTVPVQNGWNASDLADNISGCLSVSMWDSVNQTYNTYIPGWPDFDFPLVDGCGYFVDTDSSGVLVCSGQLIGSVSVALEVGWNLIGWYHDYDTLASSIAGNISGCLSVSMWDSVNQTYNTYIPGWPDFDFIVSRGMGLFVDVDQQSMWHGEG